MMNKIILSIIIPTLDEEYNLIPLVERIDQSLSEINYEILIIDDHSTDRTKNVALYLAQRFPLKFFYKQGKPGKAYSIIEGSLHAKGNIIAFIDADLQYPPEVMPEMLETISNGADVVIASRRVRQTSLIRKLTNRGFSFFFGNVLHGLKYDVQSGLKMFKTEVMNRFEIDPTPWTFDLEFLLKARHAGYKIRSVPITFSERFQGKTKVKLLSAVTEIGLSALKLKFKSFEPIPFDPVMAAEEGKGFHYNGQKFVHHSDLPHHETAFFRLSRGQMKIMTVLVILLAVSFILSWHTTIVVILFSLSVIYLADIFFNLYLITRSYTKTPEIRVKKRELLEHSDDWPSYTIFCPLYKEWSVIPQFVKSILRLDYPKDKLQVLLLLEEDDFESIEKVGGMKLPGNFEVVIVPDSAPKTKPKACNYGLLRATGEYSVIYDAEDIPERDQLKKTVIAFEKSDPRVVCMQAKLNFYNPRQNVLTRVFTAEYSLWFDLTLTGLQSINAPIPLGGTSNHFKTENLKKLKGWDAFNVTEDCDLGMRLVKEGYTTAIVHSTTFEEANSDFSNWLGQRTRWIKGYIQSYLVHMRTPKKLMKDLNNPHLLTFQFIVGGKVLMMFINPLLWVSTITYFAFRPVAGTFIESFFPGPVLYMSVFAFVVGNFLYFYYYMIGCAKRGHYDLIKYGLLIPFYWLAMSYSAWLAVYKIIAEPHYWYKTKHGLHLNDKQQDFVKSQALGFFHPQPAKPLIQQLEWN